MGQAFYRKYRSKALSEVVGQRHITDTIQLALKNGMTSHAYLFTGPRGVGKTSVARILAHEINKLPYSEESQHLDIIEIDAASNRRIDDVRDLRDKIHIAPVSAPYKVYIIDEVHMLTGESFNALLKTLEEPPAHVVFILATTEVHKLPATIISRTQRFHFRPASTEDLIAHLRSIAKLENIAVEPGALKLIAEYGDGSFRDSVSLLDQLSSMSGGEVTASFAEDSLGLASDSDITNIIEHIKKGDRANIHADLAKLEDRGVNGQTVSKQLISTLKKLSIDNPSFYSLVEQLLEIHKSSNPQLKLLVTLMHFCPNNEQLKPTNKHIAVTANPKVHTIKRAPNDIKTAASPINELPSSAPNKNTTVLLSDHWDIVLSEFKTSNPPLYSLVKKAEPRFSEDALTLAFSFKLHQIKMDDSKNRTKLSDCINKLGYKCPAIIVMHDTQSTPPPESIKHASIDNNPLDETAASVLAMMGGGDIVHA